MSVPLAHLRFKSLSIADKCTWYGTKYAGEGKDKYLLDCGEPTVGAGVFCDPGHKQCFYASVCERHVGTAPFWDEEAEA